MKAKSSLISFLVIAMLVALLLLVLYPMLNSPILRFSEACKKKQCRQCMAMLLSATNLFDTAQETADQLRYWKDPWGNYYNVIVADKFSILSFGIVSSGDLIIWSSGPNGVNENGQGDDILGAEEICQKVGKHE